MTHIPEELPEELLVELVAFLNLVGGTVGQRPIGHPEIRSPDEFEFAFGGWAMSLSSALESPESFVPLSEAEKLNLEGRLERSTGLRIDREHWYPPS